MILKKVLKNVGASFLTQILNIVINFILPPLIIGTYGSKVNGLVLTIKQILSYIKLVGAGISVAITHSLYKPLAYKNSNKVNGVLNAANNMFFKAGIIFVISSIAISFIYPIFLKDNDLEYTLVLTLILVMSIEGASEFFVVGKYRTLLFADQKSYIVSITQSIGLVISFINAYILIKLNFNIVLVQLAISSVFIIRMVLLSFYVKKNYVYLNRNIKPIKSIERKRNDAFIHQISGLIILSSQAIILSTFVGLEAASIYAVYNVIFSGLHSILSQVIGSVAPFLGKSIAMNKYDNLKSHYNKLEFIYSSLLTLIYSVCSIMVIPFINIYIGNVSDINYIDYLFAYLFISVSFLNSLRFPAQSTINVAGHFRETRNKAIIEALLCLILQLIFVNFWGIYGVLIGTGISLLWRSFDIIIYANNRIIKQANNLSILRVLKTPLISFFLLYLNYQYINFELASSFGEWVYISLFFLSISFTMLIIITLIFETKELIELIKLIKIKLVDKSKINK